MIQWNGQEGLLLGHQDRSYEVQVAAEVNQEYLMKAG